MSRLQHNYDLLIWFIAEIIHVASDESRTSLLGECALNLPDEALHDIKTELLYLRSCDKPLQVAA